MSAYLAGFSLRIVVAGEQSKVAGEQSKVAGELL